MYTTVKMPVLASSWGYGPLEVPFSDQEIKVFLSGFKK